MADKRMISRLITQRASFLRMPGTAQALYMHLCLNADDEGIAEAFAVIGMIRGKDEDLEILNKAGFIQILDNENLVVYITGWNSINNPEE